MNGCKHNCEKPAVFPGEIFNRPGLGAINYRIGTYSRIREHQFNLLNKSRILTAWTHRGSDDPGIALLEGNAIIGDILMFYQNLYGNEAFLRTADWRESVSALVQLLGYRLAPGVGGEAIFAVKVKDETAVTVPKSFGFKAQLQDREQTDEFESTEEVIAYPHLSEFNLYRQPRGLQSISAGNNKLELHAVEGETDLTSLQSVEIKEGDRIILVPDSSMFDNDGVIYSEQDKPEILIVSTVETVLNRIIITFEGSLTVNRGSAIRAYIIDRTFHHFGYNASRKLTKYDGNDVSIENTNFERVIAYTHSGSEYYSKLTNLEIPLDQEVDDLALGGKLICQGLADSSTEMKDNEPFIVVKTIEEVVVNTLQWGNIEGSVTIAKIDSKLMANEDIWLQTTDVRQTRVHEVISSELTLRATTVFNNGDFSNGDLEYFGTYDEAKALMERGLLLVNADNEAVQTVVTTSTLTDLESQLADRDGINLWLWTVTLDQIPKLKQEDFDQVETGITVYGNLVHADQGKSQKEVILGNGDNRKVFQTFAIPKAPMTYLLYESQTPAQVPELQIYVDGILWQKVDIFFNSGTDDQIYVVREDNDGNSFVQFGDGKTGARLSSGKNNVVAIYRTGIGATGVLEKDATPSATGKLKKLEKVFLPGEVVGGDESETEDNAREAAPGKMQSLARLVGLADYEAEAKALPGVLKVRADWAAPNGVPLVRIVVLTETGTAAAVKKLQDILNTYNRCRGPARFPVYVVQGNLQYIYLSVRAGYEASRRKEDIEVAINLSLGLVGEEGNGILADKGLFSLKQRNFGQGVHRSQIVAAIQQVEGVTWVEIDDAQALDLGMPPETDPTVLPEPVVESIDKAIACLSTRILALHSVHFDINMAMDETKKECG